MAEQDKKTILAIDDDITMLTTIRNILGRAYEVSLAKSSDVAWTILNNTRVDMILLDVEMPNLSGLQFLDLLRLSTFYYTPVIFVTSHATSDVIVQAKKAGAKGFIVKPLAPRVLLDKVRAVFDSIHTPIGREALAKQLHLLNNACKKGHSGEIDRLMVELSKIHYNLDTDTQIVEIGKYTNQLDYKMAVEKIAQVLQMLSK